MNKRIFCILLSISMLISTNTAFAGPPTVTTDEAVYVNLDYYGKLSDISVVKSSSLNQNSEFIDYGGYESVTNMTNYAQPVITEEGVSWKLDEVPERFYYECKPKEGTIQIPWTFDISYKLDGVPKKAEELAGASGLIEITIEAIPNENVDDYYKNNMLLQMATMVNMEDNFSLDAPGSQLQSMGTYKAVVFMALPGEHTTFTMRIGSNSFESPGITMMIIPGTLSQLQDIKDLKESKDKVQDAANAVKDSMDDIIDTMQGMSQGLEQTKQGLNSLNEARETISNSKGEVYENADIALEDLTKLTGNINSLVPHLQNGQQMVKDINRNVNELVNTMKTIKTDLEEYKNSITQIQQDIEALQKLLDDVNAKEEDRKDAFDRLSRNLKRLTENLDKLQLASTNLDNGMRRLSDTSANLGNTSSEITNISNILGNIIINVTGGDPATQAGMSMVNNSISNIKTSTQQLLNSVSSVSYSTSVLFNDLKETMTYGSSIADSLRQIMNLCNEYADLASENHENTQDLFSQINTIGEISKGTLDKISTSITNITNLNNTFNTYEQDTETLLKDTEGLTTQMSTTLSNSINFLNSLKLMMQISGEQLDKGTEKTLNGFIDVIDAGISGVNKTDNIKNANQLIKDTIDNELNHFEEDNHLLNIDAQHPLVSVTSEKNPTPDSVQIILRTQEISIDDDKTSIDLEKESENVGIWARIENIFKKIWETVSSIFQS